jgi:hypothetical protein
VHAVARITEVLHVGPRHDVGFGENDGIALAPLHEFPE